MQLEVEHSGGKELRRTRDFRHRIVAVKQSVSSSQTVVPGPARPPQPSCLQRLALSVGFV